MFRQLTIRGAESARMSRIAVRSGLTASRVSRRAESSKTPNPPSSKREKSDSNSERSSGSHNGSTDPVSATDAQILLDELFNVNKPRWYETSRRESAPKGKDGQLEKLDAKLKELQRQPVDFHYYMRNLDDLKSSKQLPYKFGGNQLVSNDPQMTKLLKQIVWEFDAPIRYAFGYGSKVFSQGKDVDISNSQLDMVFAVSYPDHWHSLNLNQNSAHYSNLKYLGSDAIARIGNWGAGVYYNPFVKMNFSRSEKVNSDFELKYGVVSIDRVTDDLRNWSSMYLAGRMHKPVAVVRNLPKISLLEQFNLVSGLKLSTLLLNKDTVKESELYETVASLSYLGDPRTQVGGENPNKVHNIVTNQFGLFRELYLPLIEDYMPDLLQRQTSSEEAADHTFKVNLDVRARSGILSELPLSYRQKVLSKYTEKYQNSFAKDPISQNTLGKLPAVTKDALKPAASHEELSFLDLQELSSGHHTRLNEIPIQDWEYIPTLSDFKNAEFIQDIAKDSQLVDNLKLAIKQTVARPATIQSTKGILTAGIGKSIKYAMEKRRKYKQAKKD